MKRVLFCLLLLVADEQVSLAGPITSLDDILLWVGTGTNRSAIAIDWDGSGASDTSWVWGYRWSGSATGEQMLRSVLGTDPRLFAKLGTPGAFGVPLYGLGYDLDADGQFGLSDGTLFDSMGIAITGPSDGVLASDSGDLYREGWLNGFWNYGVSESNPFDGGTWAGSNEGMGDRLLQDGSWDSWAFDADFSLDDFALNPRAATVPEPSVSALCLVALACLWILGITKVRKGQCPHGSR